MGFSRRNKIQRCRVAVDTLWEKRIRFRHPDYGPDRAQKLISSSMSRHLTTRNISSKSMHAFLSNLAQTDKQTDKRTRARGRKHIPPPLSDVNNTNDLKQVLSSCWDTTSQELINGAKDCYWSFVFWVDSLSIVSVNSLTSATLFDANIISVKALPRKWRRYWYFRVVQNIDYLISVFQLCYQLIKLCDSVTHGWKIMVD